MKELEDHAWFPSEFRNYQTGFTGFVAVHSRVYSGFIRYLETFSFSQRKMTDLCSGSGEPAISIFRKSGQFRNLQLTDLYPVALPFSDSSIYYNPFPHDALKMEFDAATCYTMFNAFHHFTDEEKLQLVKKIRSSGATAFIAEVLEPTFLCFLKIFFLTTAGSLLLTPFIRPFSFRRLFFTYIIPVNLLTISFDGLVSVIKSRTEKHYKKLFAGQEGIKLTRLKTGAGPVIVIRVNE